MDKQSGRAGTWTMGMRRCKGDIGGSLVVVENREKGDDSV